MTRDERIRQIKQKRSFLCVGLDTDVEKIPPFLLKYKDPVVEFNKQIIEATADLCVAYKPNIAFYESRGCGAAGGPGGAARSDQHDGWLLGPGRAGSLGRVQCGGGG